MHTTESMGGESDTGIGFLQKLRKIKEILKASIFPLITRHFDLNSIHSLLAGLSTLLLPLTHCWFGDLCFFCRPFRVSGVRRSVNVNGSALEHKLTQPINNVCVVITKQN